MKDEKAKALQLITERPYLIGRAVGFKDLTDLHNKWIRSFIFSKTSQTLQAHRGSYKTTCLSVFFALCALIYPNKNILFFRKTDNDVTEVIKQTQKILETGAMNRLAYALYGAPIEFVKSSSSEITTRFTTSPRGSSWLSGLGIGTSITGKHADIVVTDDIVNLRDRVSRAERETTKIQYMELQNIVNRGGRMINTGTPWHKEDAFTLMPNVSKYDCYRTGLISPNALKELRQSMSDSLFAANYELKHIADKDAMFKNPVFGGKISDLYNGLAHIDAGYDGEDFTAFTAMKKDAGGRIIALGKMWDKHVDDCLTEIQMIMQQYRLGSIACEKNADKGYLAKELRKRGMQVHLYSENMNKFVKIATYLRAAWQSIVWLEETDPEYISQVLDYTEFAEHDDAPDSAASMIRRLENKIVYNAVKGGL